MMLAKKTNEELIQVSMDKTNACHALKVFPMQ